MPRKNGSLIFIPVLRSYEVKNPRSLFPIDWVAKYGEDRVRFDEIPEYDKDGNYLGTKTDVYVTMFEVVRWKIIKRKQPLSEDDITSKRKQRKLFETYSDRKEKEEECKLLQNKSLSPVCKESLNN